MSSLNLEVLDTKLSWSLKNFLKINELTWYDTLCLMFIVDKDKDY